MPDKTQEQLQKILLDLLALPENRDCADCGAKGPRWASCNIGVFVCINCSGIHRSLGTHISKVRSVSLDKWTPEQVRVMQDMGNGKAKDIYEHNVPSHYRRPNENDTYALEQWIRAKYDRKEFMKREGQKPKEQPSSSSSSSSSKSKTTTSAKQQPTTTTKTSESKSTKGQSANVADLLLLDDDSSASQQQQQTNNQNQFQAFQGFVSASSSNQQQQQQQNNSGDQFQGFQSFQGASTPAISNDLFTGFQSANTTVSTQPTNNVEAAFWNGDANNTQANKASKDSILQLFQTPLSVTSTMSTPSSMYQQQQQKFTPNYNVPMTGLSTNTGYGNTNTTGFNMNGYANTTPTPTPTTTGYSPYGMNMNMNMNMNTNMMMPSMNNPGMNNPGMNNLGYGGYSTPSPALNMNTMNMNMGMSNPSYVNPNYMATMTPTTSSTSSPVILPTSAANFRL